MHAHALRRSLPPAISVLAVAALLATCGAAAANDRSARNPKPKTSAARVTRSLTGTWSGQYGGAFSGTFRLHWTQTGNKVRGTIKLSPGGTAEVTGSVNGTTITFGAVGGGNVITYTGSASASAMSGRYKTPKGGGSWSAHRS